jgi:hypothetical protein
MQAFPDVMPLVSLRIPETNIVVSPSGSYFTQCVWCAVPCVRLCGASCAHAPSF